MFIFLLHVILLSLKKIYRICTTHFFFTFNTIMYIRIILYYKTERLFQCRFQKVYVGFENPYRSLDPRRSELSFVKDNILH